MEQQKVCDKCLGEGYYPVASTIIPEDNEWVVCTNCDGSGVVELEPNDVF